MGRRDRSKSKARVAGETDALVSNPFAGLGQLASSAAQGSLANNAREATDLQPLASTQTTLDGELEFTLQAVRTKVVVRKERKGHGGKTVTFVEGLDWPAAPLRALAKQFAKAFGCSARVEGSAVVLSGARQVAVADHLRREGVRSVVVGN